MLNDDMLNDNMLNDDMLNDNMLNDNKQNNVMLNNMQILSINKGSKISDRAHLLKAKKTKMQQKRMRHDVTHPHYRYLFRRYKLSVKGLYHYVTMITC